MFETVTGMFIAVFCIAGAVSLIKWAALKIAAPRNDENRIYAVLLKGAEADIELQMAMETLEWDDALAGAGVYAVDCGLDAVMAEYCERLCENSRFRFISKEEFGTVTELKPEPEE